MHKMTRHVLMVVALFSMLFAVFVPGVSADHIVIPSCMPLDGITISAEGATNAPAFIYAASGEAGTVTISSPSNPNHVVTVYTYDIETGTLIDTRELALPVTFIATDDEFNYNNIETLGSIPITLVVSWTCGPAVGAPCFEGDARINQDDCGALVALYQDGTVIEAYGIDPASGEGVLVFSFDLATAGDVTENTLLAEGTNPFNGQPIRLYKLAGGGYQLNSTQPNGEPYEFAWS
jgi:hypothetical protein